MNTSITYVCGITAAYLIGSIPFGFLIGKMRGVDVRTVGSHNIGATNVWRTVGKKWGLIAFACDVLKGLLPVLAARAVAANFGNGELVHLPLVVGITTVVGHMWTCFLGFKGGKGVATGFGMLIGLTPALVGIALLVFIAFLLVFRYVSLGSVAAAMFMIIAVWPAEYLCAKTFGNQPDLALAILVTIVAAFAVWKHRANIARLRAGTESKFFGKSAAKPIAEAEQYEKKAETT